MDKTEFRVLIKHCFLMGKNTVQAQQWLEKCYPDSAPSKPIKKQCFINTQNSVLSIVFKIAKVTSLKSL